MVKGGLEKRKILAKIIFSLSKNASQIFFPVGSWTQDYRFTILVANTKYDFLVQVHKI